MLEVLKQEQVEFYRGNGYLVLENRVPLQMVEAIRAAGHGVRGHGVRHDALA